MDLAKLRDEIVNDPLGRGYASMAPDQIADDLNTAYRTVSVDIPLEAIVGYVLANDLWFGIRQAASDPSHTAHKAALYAIDLIEFAKAEMIMAIDPQSMTFQGLMAQLVQGGVFTQAHADAIMGMGTRIISRAEELGLGRVRTGDVIKALA